jgi:hypothetical protein
MFADHAPQPEEPVRPAFFYYGPLLCDALEELAIASEKVVCLGNYIRTHPETLRIEKFAADHHMAFSHLADTDVFKTLEHALELIDNVEPVAREKRPVNREWASAYGNIQKSVGDFIVFLGDEKKSGPLRAAYAIVDGTSLAYKGPDLSDAIMIMGELSVVANECIKQRLAELESNPLPCTL